MENRLLRGTIIQQRFEVIKHLGQGAYTSVYLVRDIEGKFVAALKLYGGHYRSNPNFMRRFEREVQISKELSHPNIVQYFSPGFYKNTPYILMEYVNGQTVQELLAYHKRVPVKIALTIFSDALRGLAYLHHHGIAHRDFKPSAIFVDTQGNVKLADFDIAKKYDEDQDVTGADSPVGSQLYMAPEQRLGHKVSPRSDIFTAVVTLYEMITGTNPWQDSDFLPTDRRAWAKIIRPSRIASDANSQIDSIILKAMDLQPVHRYQSASEFLQAIEPLKRATKNDLGQWVRGRRVSEADISQKNTKKLNSMLIIVVAALLLLALALTLWLATGDPSITPTPLP